MNNFMISLKRFLKNKNTVSVIGLIIVLALLYWGYSSTIKKATNPVSIPVAANTILPKTQITSEDITYKTVSNAMVDEAAIRNYNAIVDKYTNINVTIPQGSMFYSSWLVEKENLPGSWIEEADFKKGEEAYYMSTTMVATLGNSVVPNSYIDIYMKAEDENGTVMIGKLLSNVKVLVVHDGQGQDVFADSTNVGTPSYLGFIVNNDIYILLNKVEYLSSYGVELIIAPHGTEVPKNDAVTVKSETLRDYIDANTIVLDENYVDEEETTENETEQNSESNEQSSESNNE